MTLQDLANIGEFIGGIVVVISVLYVALQVRQNSQVLERSVQSVRTQTTQNITENFNFYRQLLMNREVAEEFIKGLDDYGALDTTGKVRFNMVASSYIWSAYYVYQINQKEGLIENLNNRMYADMFKHPGFRQWYEEYQHSIAGDFAELLSEVRAHVGDQELQPGEFSQLLQGPVS